MFKIYRAAYSSVTWGMDEKSLRWEMFHLILLFCQPSFYWKSIYFALNWSGWVRRETTGQGKLRGEGGEEQLENVVDLFPSSSTTGTGPAGTLRLAAFLAGPIAPSCSTSSSTSPFTAMVFWFYLSMMNTIWSWTARERSSWTWRPWRSLSSSSRERSGSPPSTSLNRVTREISGPFECSPVWPKEFEASLGDDDHRQMQSLLLRGIVRGRLQDKISIQEDPLIKLI